MNEQMKEFLRHAFTAGFNCGWQAAKNNKVPLAWDARGEKVKCWYEKWIERQKEKM